MEDSGSHWYIPKCPTEPIIDPRSTQGNGWSLPGWSLPPFNLNQYGVVECLAKIFPGYKGCH